MKREKFVLRLGDLVHIRTLSGDVLENTKALDLIQKWADPTVSVRRIKNRKTEILLLGNGNLLRPKYGYLVHADVVDVKDNTLFTMREKEGKLFGRGVSDMKYSIPIGIELLNQLIREKHRVDFTVAITTDEEIGGQEGSRYLAEEMKFKPAVLIVPDGGDGFVFVNKGKGVVHVRIEAEGKPTHASTPWLGKSAISPLIRLAYLLLDKYETNLEKPNWLTTMNFGIFEGGKSTNQVAGSAVLKVDFRFPETRSVGEIVGEVNKISNSIDPLLDVQLVSSGDPVSVDINNAEIERFFDVAKKVRGKSLKMDGEYGASDARYWAKYGIPIIMTKPIGGGLHSEDEWIDIDSCLEFYDILYKYIIGT